MALFLAVVAIVNLSSAMIYLVASCVSSLNFSAMIYLVATRASSPIVWTEAFGLVSGVYVHTGINIRLLKST